MKEQLYSLEDREYCLLVQRIGEMLDRNGSQYAIVGGTAAALQTVGIICQKEGRPLEDLILLEQISERQNLRRTNDVDLIIHTPEKPLAVVESLQGEVETSNDIFDITLERKGKKRPIYKVTSLNGEARVALNISHTPKDLERVFAGNYYAFLSEARDVEFDYEELHPKVKVIKPEHIIATKLSRFNPKDQFDIWNLVELSLKYGMPLNLEEIEAVLGEEFRDRIELFKAEYAQRARQKA